ncbi:MAG TPA: hypothetical protein VF247_00680 [Candidatus Krumholzibacteria bacterium]
MTRRPGRLDARRCARGHVSLHADPACATCGAPMRDVRIRADAVLELVTVVRVNPTGQPYQLGVAITRAGRVRTICRVEGSVRGLGTDAVVLERRDDMIVARPRRR